MKNKILLEANIEKHFMTKEERLLRKKLVELLVKNHHVKYAKRLALFDINIVPLSVKGGKDFTAAISFDDGVIFISEGFLQDEAIFFQLDVLMRHELAHNLMMHQIRMIKKLGDDLAKHFNCSMSIHELINIIEDLEISNTRYTEADKKIVRNMWLNGRLIGGLVTEDLRKSWLDLPLEYMYDALEKELDNINNLILAAIDDPYGVEMEELEKLEQNKDFMFLQVLAKMSNYHITSGILKKPSRATGSLEDFINGTASIYLGIDENNKKSYLYFKELSPVHQEVLTDLNKVLNLKNSSFSTELNLEQICEDIAKTAITKQYILKNTDEESGKTEQVIIVSPEEKWLVLEFLKKHLGKVRAKLKINVKKANHSDEYKEIYNKTIETFDTDKYSEEDLLDILSTLEISEEGED